MSKITERVSEVTSLLALGCVLVVSGIVVRREFFTPQTGPESAAPVHVSDWKEYLGAGHRIGSEAAPVTLLVFGDFQCPGCRRFARTTWPAIRARYGDRISLVYRHFPLSYHKWARPAAVAAECAARQGRFEAIHDVLYAQQDSLGDKSFEDFARQAGVSDVAAFTRCLADSSVAQVVSNDFSAAESFGATGTPTVAVNGYRFSYSPDSSRLGLFVDDQLKRLASR